VELSPSSIPAGMHATASLGEGIRPLPPSSLSLACSLSLALCHARPRAAETLTAPPPFIAAGRSTAASCRAPLELRLDFISLLA
jgi:hypothetical protein